MTELIPAGSTTGIDLRGIPTEELKRQLAESLQLSADALARLAAIWRELEEVRGEDLSGLRAGIGTYIAMIAAGRLTPESVVRFAGNATMLRALSEQPAQIQDMISREQPIDVVVVGGDGQTVVEQLPAYTLTAAQIRQVFAPGRLRNVDEQRAIAAQRGQRRRAAPRARQAAPEVSYDAEADIVRVGRLRVPLGDILGAVARTQIGQAPVSGDIPASDKAVLTIPIHKSERARIRQVAADGNISMAEMARGLLRRAGAI